MRSSGDPLGRDALPRSEIARAALSSRVVVALATSLAACAPQQRSTVPGERPAANPAEADPAAAKTDREAAAESPWLGAWPKAGCFRVTREGDDEYRFLIEDIEYRSARPPRAGGVDIFVHAVGIGDLQPCPIHRPRDPRLEFSATGSANGDYEILLQLVDTQGHRYEPRTLRLICPDERKGP